MPNRAEIDPRQISPLLSQSFMLERCRPEDVRFRLAGMEINALLGFEASGMQVSALFAPEHRMNFIRDLDAVFTAPEIQLYQLRDTGMRAEMVILPLKDTQGAITRAVGCLVTAPSEKTKPIQFELRGRASTHVDAFGPGDTTHVTYGDTATSDQGYDDDGPGHLSVVKD